MAKLPEGRTPLTDGDMEILLHNMARELKSENLRTVADRFAELSKGERKKIYERVGSVVYERDFGAEPSTRKEVT